MKNLRGTDFVAAAPGPGNETQEILLYRCRAGEWRRRKTSAAQFSLPPRQAPATRHKKFCCIVAARSCVGDETKEILQYCCRPGECRRRKTFAAQFSLPSRQAPATKRKKSCDIVAARDCGGDEKPSRRRFRCRRARPRQRDTRNFVVSLPRGIVSATKTKKSCCIVATQNCGGDETQEILLYLGRPRPRPWDGSRPRGVRSMGPSLWRP